MTIDVGRFEVDVDADGRIVAVRVRGSSTSLLDLVDLGCCRVAGVDLDWSSREVSVDVDEVGIATTAGDLAVELRHSFSTGWTTRLRIVNRGSDAVPLDRLSLSLRVADDHHASGMAAGSRLSWAVQADDGRGPLLAVHLHHGSVDRITGTGLELGPMRLAAQQRYVTQLGWEHYATPRSVVAALGRELLVPRTVHEVGEAVLLPDDPDAALVVPHEMTVDTVEEPELMGRELSVDEPGRHRVELRSAEGEVRLDLSWVLPLVDRLGIWSADVLAGPRTPAGVVAVDDVSAGLVVQAALGAGVLEGADDAADALDRLTARLLDRGPELADIDPFPVLYLLAEHGRTGDAEVLDLAISSESVLLAVDGPPPPGLGLAVLRTVLAGPDAGDRLAPLIRRAVQRAGVADLGEMPTDRAAALELLLAVRPLLSADHPAQQRLVELTRWLGAALGAGLPGRLISPPPVAVHAHLVAVLSMLPEDGRSGVTRTWGAAPSLLAQRATLEVLDRLDDDLVGPAAAWLALGQRHA